MDLGPMKSNRKAEEKKEEEGMEAFNDSEPTSTRWIPILTVCVVSLMIFLPQYTLITNAYAYLKKINPNAAVSLQGWKRSVMRACHAVSAAFFSCFAYMSKAYKLTLAMGVLLSIGSCIMYLFFETVPVEWSGVVWVIIFALQSSAEGSLVVLFHYISQLSTSSDRVKAFTVLEASEMAAIAIGMVVEAGSDFISTSTPIFGGFMQFNKYTAPIWICLILAASTLAVVVCMVEEPPKDNTCLKRKLTRAYKEASSKNKKMIALLLTCKCITAFGCTTILTITPPFLQSSFNQDPDQLNWSLASFQLTTGGIALLVAVIVSTLCSRTNPTYLFMTSFVFFVLAYFYCLPLFEFNTRPVEVWSDSNQFGCNVTEYLWCQDMRTVSKYAWILPEGFLMGIAVPLSNIGFNAIYSKILTGIDRNILEGVQIVSTDGLMAAVPIAATHVFKNHGPTVWWQIALCVCIFGLLLFAVIFAKLNAYMEEEEQRNRISETERMLPRENSDSVGQNA